MRTILPVSSCPWLGFAGSPVRAIAFPTLAPPSGGRESSRASAARRTADRFWLGLLANYFRIFGLFCQPERAQLFRLCQLSIPHCLMRAQHFSGSEIALRLFLSFLSNAPVFCCRLVCRHHTSLAGFGQTVVAFQLNSPSRTTRSKFSFAHLIRYRGSSASGGSSRTTLQGLYPMPVMLVRRGVKCRPWPMLNLCSDIVILGAVTCEHGKVVPRTYSLSEIKRRLVEKNVTTVKTKIASITLG